MPGLNQQIENDLPLDYQQDFITLLARDPHWLYAYWEISQDHLELFAREFGPEAFNKSQPVLKITNVTGNESFYIRINDFSNNWYINVPHPNSVYVAEIGRKISENFFIGFAASNRAVTPGDSFSSDSSSYFINYSDLRNGKQNAGIYKKAGAKIQGNSFVPSVNSSSLEFAGHAVKEINLGESSANLYGIPEKG